MINRRSVLLLLGKPRGLVRNIIAYRWARAELAVMKAMLPEKGVKTRARPGSQLAPQGTRGVFRAVSKESPTCLERALVLQAWMSNREVVPDVVLGVRAGESVMQAHAWVEGADPWYDESYTEISRLGFSQK